MSLIKKRFLLPVCIMAIGVVFFACSKNEETVITGIVAPLNPCASRTITINATSAAPTSPCINDGKVTVTAAGSIEFTYSIDGSGFQASNVFTNLAPGDHTYVVKDGTGCSKSASVNVPALHPGAMFIAVKLIMINKCVTCHGGVAPVSGLDLNNDCVIAGKALRIAARTITSDTAFRLHTGFPATVITSADSSKILEWKNTSIMNGGISPNGAIIPSVFYTN